MGVKFPGGNEVPKYEEDWWKDRDDWRLTIHQPSRDNKIFDPASVQVDDMTVDGECAAMKFDSDERERRRQTIFDEAPGANHAIQRLLKRVGMEPYFPPRPDLIDWVDLVLDNIVGVIYREKKRWERPRPIHNCYGLVEVIDQRSFFYPRNPGYPGGHAATAYTVAWLLSDVFPQYKDDLEDLAKDIGRNREVAGLHFPSDTASGKRLAELMVAKFRAVPPSDADPQIQANHARFRALSASLASG